MLCATLGDVRACGSSKNCFDSNAVGHADDTGDRMCRQRHISRRLLEAWCRDSGSPFLKHQSKKVWKRCTTAAPANAFGNEPREAARKTPPNPRHGCVQHSSLHPSSDPRPLSARRHSAPATGQVKKRTQSHDLQFPDRSICSRCRWRKISASGSERCDTT